MRAIRRFTPAEDAVLRERCTGDNCSALAREMGRSAGSVTSRATALGLRTASRKVSRFTPEEDAIIRRFAGTRPATEIARLLGRGPHSNPILQRMGILGIRPTVRFARGYITSRGYRTIPLVDANGRRYWVQEHILVAEQTLGRKLKKGEVVHHINLNKTDNAPGNLYVCRSDSQHASLHRSVDTLLAQLLERGFLVFNFTEGHYELCETSK